MVSAMMIREVTSFSLAKEAYLYLTEVMEVMEWIG